MKITTVSNGKIFSIIEWDEEKKILTYTTDIGKSETIITVEGCISYEQAKARLKM